MAKAGRPTDQQRFLDRLKDLSDQGKNLITNQLLRSELEWNSTDRDRIKYDRIKDDLRREQRIIVAAGYGGKVGLATQAGSSPVSLFISYSHEDEALKNELVAHLLPLQRIQLIESWHDGKIQPGKEWNKVIVSKLEESKIILLLVSVHFLNSDYCYGVELGAAIERHEEGSALVLPILIKNCVWKLAPFAKLQMLRANASVNAASDRDLAWSEVVDNIKEAAEEIRGRS